MFEAYPTTLSNGTIEANSLATIRQHLARATESLGVRFRVQELSLADLQGHVEKRRKRGIAPTTIQKELSTFRACWNWAVYGKLLTGPFPNRGLRYPKDEEKEPSRTFAEIQAITAGKPEHEDTDGHWESLYLTREEIGTFLGVVQANATLPWVYPLIALCAYTGARRSELLRAEVTDVDVSGGTVIVREKKRGRGKRSTRIAPLTPQLRGILRDWLGEKPASTAPFCQDARGARSKTKRDGPTAVTKDEAHDHFRRTLADTKWSVVRGFHVLRHSFISALACEGVDQRVIDELVGHQSEEQRRRYRHLYPKVMQDAVGRVFGVAGDVPSPGDSDG